MVDRIVEEQVILQKLNGGVQEESIEYSIKKIKKKIEMARRDGQLILNGPIVSRPGIIGKIIIIIKKVVRKCVWWYINPVCDQQNKFNDEIIDVLNDVLLVINSKNQKDSDET